MARLYELPEFLKNVVSQESYLQWLQRKANAHLKRDRKRGNTVATRASYKLGIHKAVLRSEGKDEYTGRLLRWDLISQYRNDDASAKRGEYNRELYDLPTIDHVGDGLGAANFAICSWRVNDAKHVQTFDEFVEMCRLVVGQRHVG
jgi:hypothetical protein